VEKVVNSALSNRPLDSVHELRLAAGEWLRARREQCGYSQSDLAKVLKLEYYTFISQIENGRGRIPPNRYAEWADALKISRREFALQMMRYYDPITYDLIFSSSQ